MRLWCCLFAPYASPTLRPSPAVAGLVGFRCSPPHRLSLRVCVWVLSGAAELCLLCLLLLGAGLAVVEPLAGVCFCASSVAPAVFPRRVLPQVGLRRLRKLFWLQLPVLLLRWSYVCWICGVFGAALGFPSCAVLFLRGLWFCAGCPSGFLPFLTPSA